jgi:hypothetical protein
VGKSEVGKSGKSEVGIVGKDWKYREMSFDVNWAGFYLVAAVLVQKNLHDWGFNLKNST